MLNDEYIRYTYELCIVGLTFPEAMTLVLRDKYALCNSAVARKLSEILDKNISPQASANFYRKARIKISEINSTYSTGAESDPSVFQPSQKVK